MNTIFTFFQPHTIVSHCLSQTLSKPPDFFNYYCSPIDLSINTSPFSAVHMRMFRAVHLGSDTLSEALSLEKTDFLSVVAAIN